MRVPVLPSQGRLNLFANSNRTLKLLVGVAGVLAVLAWLPYLLSPRLNQLTLEIGSGKLRVEVADREAYRMRGMMFRLVQKSDEGMLFVFPAAKPLCMWMKNTLVPLSVAFIRADGSIVNTADMASLSLDTHCAQEPVRFALEVPQGWFAARSIGTGSRIAGLPP